MVKFKDLISTGNKNAYPDNQKYFCRCCGKEISKEEFFSDGNYTYDEYCHECEDWCRYTGNLNTIIDDDRWHNLMNYENGQT